MGETVFADRTEAGQKLAAALKGITDDALVLALPRGGVPVAFEVAKAFGAPLDLLIVRKIGAPGNDEFGIGAVVGGANPQLVVNDEAMREVDPPPGYLERTMKLQLKEIDRRRKTYLRGRTPIPVTGRRVILIDDGIATGGTAHAALQALRQNAAAHVILAIPVSPQDALDRLTPLADDIVCLLTPHRFHAVSQVYRHFTQTTDREVVDLLNASNAWRRDQ